jgi:hypothetical protein
MSVTASIWAADDPAVDTPLRSGTKLRHHVLMESYEELTGVTDEQLIAVFDQDRQNVSVGKQWYLDENTRRRTDRATEALVRLTRQLAVLTVVITLLTAVGAAASVVAALSRSDDWLLYKRRVSADPVVRSAVPFGSRIWLSREPSVPLRRASKSRSSSPDRRH